MAFIYKITNNLNGKSYIGKTERPNPYTRWSEHKRDYNNGRYPNRALYRAFDKYGLPNFTFAVIEETLYPDVREKYYIEQYNTFGNNGYNLTKGGDSNSYIDIKKEDLQKVYKQLPLKKTAAYFNVDIVTLRRLLAKYNIPIIDCKTQTRAIIGKKVQQIDLNTNKVVDTFGSCAEAEVLFNKTKRINGHVSDVCRGIRKSAYGYAWRFEDN